MLNTQFNIKRRTTEALEDSEEEKSKCTWSSFKR